MVYSIFTTRRDEFGLIDVNSCGKKRQTGCSRRRVNFVELQVLNRHDDSMGFTSPFFLFTKDI